jgi:hypothetical protein
MATPVWPTELPQRFLASGYSEKLRDGRLFVRTSTGPGKARRRYSSAVIPASGTIYLTHAQKGRFERFWYEDTDGGVKAFILPDQTRDGIDVYTASSLPILTGSGDPLIITSNWLAMFSPEAPSFTPMNGGYFSVSFSLNVMP